MGPKVLTGSEEDDVAAAEVPHHLHRLTTASLTYSEVGSTGGTMPAGYRHLEERLIVGSGPERFANASERLLSWDMHRRAGLEVVVAAEEVVLGHNALLRIRLGPVWIEAPVRIVEIVQEPDRRGFAYGTLSGHPESGEERFLVHRLPDGRVEAEIRAFSRPARWFSRVGGPVGRRVQDRMTQRYLRALS